MSAEAPKGIDAGPVTDWLVKNVAGLRPPLAFGCAGGRVVSSAFGASGSSRSSESPRVASAADTSTAGGSTAMKPMLERW